ncbi:MoxR family ATPase [Vibrio sp. SS-MA-C1-2]|uniref:AAA family ATPase n=1 Tax=Vibrio sp. SS-MA-C1-2 TaxID=2908646 RepID=UPI001F3554D2|nr:MoxR family ATPase [Vibrio sp. SS-MA-C1-2]UJF18354.1 MoxR family ATPase [Vibrio sp. SS-MA-C1-2]
MNPSQHAVQQLMSSINQSVVGQQHVVKALVIALLADGHILLEGLPGTAKTRSIKALADSLSASFGRIQFTPDLLPSDVTGTDVYQEINGKPNLTFQPGPIFNSIVLADEINRAPAKVQAALLEAMAEGTLTVGDITHQLPTPFMVLATQNPIEQEGTYPLPEAQMDRFLMKVTVNYPDDHAELAIIRMVRDEEQNSHNVTVKVDPEHILAGRAELNQIHTSEIIERYIVGLVMATRHPERYSNSPLASWLTVGVSPRASIALDRCSRAHAWLSGRDYVEPDDVRAVVHSVLAHRLIVSFDAIADNISPKQVVDELLNSVIIG